MDAARIQARAVVKVVAISLCVIAVAALLLVVILHVRTTLRWLFAAVFLTLALNPAVDRIESVHLRGRHPFPRWLSILLVYLITFGVFVFLVLQVVPPIITEFEHLGSKVPGYIADFRQWANQNPQFQHLNHKYDITGTLQSQASSIPSKLGAAAGDVRDVTVSVLEHLIAAVTILALTFFLLLDGRQQGERLLAHFDDDTAVRLPPDRHSDRRGGQVLRHREPRAGDRRRRLHLALAGAAGRRPRRDDGRHRRVLRPDAADRVHDRRRVRRDRGLLPRLPEGADRLGGSVRRSTSRSRTA